MIPPFTFRLYYCRVQINGLNAKVSITLLGEKTDQRVTWSDTYTNVEGIAMKSKFH